MLYDFSFSSYAPTAIKATYKKRLQLRKQEEVAPELLFLFQDREAIDWEAIETQPHLYRTIQQEIKHGTIEVVYQVKDKVQKKKQRVVQPELPEDKLELAAFELKSKKQQDVLYYFVENYKSVPLKVITEELQITDAPIKALVKRDYSQKSMWKCTEIRMTMTILNKRNHSHLLRNKSKLLHRFYHQLQMKLTIHFYYMVLQEAEKQKYIYNL